MVERFSYNALTVDRKTDTKKDMKKDVWAQAQTNFHTELTSGTLYEFRRDSGAALYALLCSLAECV